MMSKETTQELIDKMEKIQSEIVEAMNFIDYISIKSNEMSKADKMLFERGFELVETVGDPDSCMRVRYETKRGDSITFGHSIKTLSISFPYMDLGLWLAINEKMKELGWINNGVPPLKIKDEEFGKDLPEEFADEVWYSYYCGNEECTNNATFGPWDKYCSECGAKIDWNSYKTQESEVK